MTNKDAYEKIGQERKPLQAVIESKLRLVGHASRTEN